MPAPADISTISVSRNEKLNALSDLIFGLKTLELISTGTDRNISWSQLEALADRIKA